MKIFPDTENTHMPFIHGTKLYHCRAPLEKRNLDEDIGGYPVENGTLYNAYDIYVSDLDGQNLQRIGGGIGEVSIACTPTVYTHQGETHLNYVASSTEYRIRYHYYRRTFSNGQWSGLKRNKDPIGVRVPYCLSENSKYVFVCYPKQNNARVFRHNKITNTGQTFHFPNIDILIRAVPVANNDEVFIITYEKNGKYCSALIQGEIFKRIKVSGEDIYKCSILDQTIVYSTKTDDITYLSMDTYTLTSENSQVRVLNDYSSSD